MTPMEREASAEQSNADGPRGFSRACDALMEREALAERPLRRDGISLRDPLIGRAEKRRCDSRLFRTGGGQGCCNIRA
jgi:hypothetical protein